MTTRRIWPATANEVSHTNMQSRIANVEGVTEKAVERINKDGVKLVETLSANEAKLQLGIDALAHSLQELVASTGAKFLEHSEALESQRQLLQSFADDATTPLDSARLVSLETKMTEVDAKMDEMVMRLQAMTGDGAGRAQTPFSERSMMDSKTYAAMTMFSNSDKDNFKKWSSQFEDVAHRTFGPVARDWLSEAAALDKPVRTLSELMGNELVFAMDAWCALGFKLDGVP